MTKLNKTQPTKLNVSEYINSISNKQEKQNAETLLEIFKKATKAKPVMWGNIIGFGSYHYVYDSGREGEMLATGFAMRKTGPVIYIIPGYNDYSDLLERIGVQYKLGKSCLYLKNIEDVQVSILKKIIKTGLKDLKKKYSVII